MRHRRSRALARRRSEGGSRSDAWAGCDEACDEQRGRATVHLQRCAKLLEQSTIQHCDPLAIDIASVWSCVTYTLWSRLVLEVLQLGAHICTQRSIKFVTARPSGRRAAAHHRAPERHALLLPPESCLGRRSAGCSICNIRATS